VSKNVTKVSTGKRGLLRYCQREGCGKIIRAGWGRPRLYCSNACKQSAYRKRVQVRREAQRERAFKRRWGIASGGDG